MSIDSYQRQVTTCQKNIAKLQADKGKAAAKAADAQKKQGNALAAARRTTSLPTIKAKQRDADRYASDHAKAMAEVAKFDGKIASEQKKQLDAQHRLDQEAARHKKKYLADQKKNEAESKKQALAQRREDQAHELRMRKVDAGLARHEILHAQTALQLQILQTLPERITVLFFSADPGRSTSNALALDEEVRLIERNIRLSKHRDAIDFQTRWAARPSDILQAINELEPTVVHFSGHGTSDDELVLLDELGEPKLIRKEAIVRAITAPNSTIKLVFFNSCFSYNQAEACAGNISAAVGMNREIGDLAARVFAAQFYSGIGFGLSIPKAFAQAQAALMMEDMDQADIPELYQSTTCTEEDLTLVRPAATPGN
ncbi:hypothetical protein PS943_04381 [Pseudomonas fluorescens]|uniref:CHAT domain-containing protein n=1 Tax=Pseudomonas fluorescens TaxID=294 RepID=A0A5E7WJF2_PSEFL|nr:CHAT domain-containing protein [Pseudomonas fluorescens]VVQ35509.1 hypothetical protein PS943_04381 [Pseudomonas fluorescens]